MEREQKAAIAAEKTMLSDARRLDKEARADELTRTRRDWWMRAGLALAGLAALVWLAIVPLKRR
jgi:ferric-dicitrate binding protein FerR (iron transport regulator)